MTFFPFLKQTKTRSFIRFLLFSGVAKAYSICRSDKWCMNMQQVSSAAGQSIL